MSSAGNQQGGASTGGGSAATNVSINPAQNVASLMKPNLSSLPLEMLTFFGGHFAPFFFFLNLCLFTYKALRYYYPGRLLGWELTTVFLYAFIEYVRLLMASKGNKTGQLQPFIQSIVLSLPIIVLHVYYISLQTYVLRVDLVLNAFAFFLLGCEIFLSAIVMLNIFLTSRQF